MEKTIEERANDAYAFCETERENAKGRENTGGWYFPSVYRSGYIKGATEQKDIDDKVAFEEREKAFKAGYDTAIENAVEWLLKNGFVDMDEPGTDIHFKSGYIHYFRKAMKD